MSHNNIAFLDHYPNLADFRPLTRSESVEPFASINAIGSGRFPSHPNYFFHVHPWDPHFAATESNHPLRIPQNSFISQVPVQYVQTNTGASSLPWRWGGWIVLAVLLLFVVFFHASSPGKGKK